MFALSTLRVSDLLSFESVRKADLKAGKRERETQRRPGDGEAVEEIFKGQEQKTR